LLVTGDDVRRFLPHGYGVASECGTCGTAPRFRAADGARPVWLANVAIINALRQIPSFTGSVTSLVNDNQPDSIPEVLSIDIYEDSAMDASNAISGHKNLAILDMNSFINNRQPELLIYEPLFKDQSTGRPAGQAGWFSWSRTGSDLTTATACQNHTTEGGGLAKGKDKPQSRGLDPFTECGTVRVPVCCEACAH
jgi:hypothetical protein